MFRMTVEIRTADQGSPANDAATAMAKVVAITDVGTKVITDLIALTKINVDEAKNLSDQIASTYGASVFQTLAFLLVAIVGGVVLAVWVARGISSGANAAAKAAAGIAVGELDQTIDVRSADEIGQMADSMRSMID
jgi:methyl-accepting chemotaxis protein